MPDARAVSLKKIKDYSLVGLRVQYFPFPFFTRQLNFPFAAFRGLPICMYIQLHLFAASLTIGSKSRKVELLFMDAAFPLSTFERAARYPVIPYSF